MKQYYNIKSKHPDAILLFRVGDFYETFSDDAVKAAGILGITLTKRANGAASYVELAGFPHHALETYLPKLVRAGQRVAICEQLEDPKLTKKIVKRGVTELITPGITLSDNVLEHKENNYLACVHIQKQLSGVAFLDLSTGEFFVAEGNHAYIDKLLNGLNPKEVLYERSMKKIFEELFGSRFYSYPVDEWMFVEETATDKLLKQFETTSLKGFGIQDMGRAITAAGAVLHYLDLTHHDRSAHITKLSRIEEDKYVWLDKFTIRNLELVRAMSEGGKNLLSTIDQTQTAMGGRLLKRWIVLPLKNEAPVKKRLDMVELLKNEEETRERLSNYIKEIGDLERLISKVSLNRVTPREVRQLRNALAVIPPIKQVCEETGNPHFRQLAEQLNPCLSIRERIEKELNEDPPNQLQKGNVIAGGVDEELDQLRELAYSGKDYLDKLQVREAKITGIPSLKISYNNVFGYYFEVRNTHKNRVPDSWIRKQTLVSAERYINEELKEYESKILGAEDKIQTIEARLYADLVQNIMEFAAAIQQNAQMIALLDIYIAFARVAIQYNYVKPVINSGTAIDIRQGRHPVIELELPMDEEYIPNDVKLNDKNQQIIIITGPNMAGKSALLRQTALIVLMAQIGCFVPAEKATIGLVDKIFTRVGASDNISSGESTFMVEMNEASSILNNLSDRSLVLFDELGRGTSTYDGISIAWAIVEYIHEYPAAKAKTLFATHYHELNVMEKNFSRIKNYNVSVKELGNKIIFLRKLIPGGSEHSFGIHVAKMAGMPKSVVERANTILGELENARDHSDVAKPVEEIGAKREGYQLSFFQLDDPVLTQIKDEIERTDVNNLTPLEALNKINDIKRLIGLKK